MERSEPLSTTVFGQRSQFEREKERLIADINQEMDAVNRNLIQLNQNLESAISLSTNFDRIGQLWSAFGTIINPSGEGEHGEELDADTGVDERVEDNTDEEANVDGQSAMEEDDN
ncbi:hypothetical protein H4R24_000831 [Coemansia sp. RSA 988]|nr:hypothetical protein H4R24_000831 [Coemansia sp. RSA 988]